MTNKKIIIFSLIFLVLFCLIFVIIFSQDILTHKYKKEIIEILDKHQNINSYEIVSETSGGGRAGKFWENLSITVINNSIKKYKIELNEWGGLNQNSINQECYSDSRDDENCYYSNESYLNISKYLITSTSQQLKNQMNEIVTIFNINKHNKPDKIGLLAHKFAADIYRISKKDECYEIKVDDTNQYELCIYDNNLKMNGIFGIYSSPTRSTISYLY